MSAPITEADQAKHDATEAQSPDGDGLGGSTVRPLPEYTYERGEGPKCPFCGTVWTADEPHYYDDAGFEEECSECGNHIRIEPVITVEWKTSAIRWANDQAQPPLRQTPSKP